MSTYRFRFTTYNKESHANVPRVIDISRGTTVGALEQFHRTIQFGDPCYRPSEYKLISMHHLYNAGIGKTEMVESEIDLPRTQNPDFLGAPETMGNDNETGLLPMRIDDDGVFVG